MNAERNQRRSEPLVSNWRLPSIANVMVAERAATYQGNITRGGLCIMENQTGHKTEPKAPGSGLK